MTTGACTIRHMPKTALLAYHVQTRGLSWHQLLHPLLLLVLLPGLLLVQVPWLQLPFSWWCKGVVLACTQGPLAPQIPLLLGPP